MTPPNSDGDTFSINPSFTGGLTLDANKGVIQGKVSEAISLTTHVITQTKPNDSVSNYTITIKTGNVYLKGGQVGIKLNTSVTLNPVKHINGSTYDIAPTLPTGLSLDGNTGVISGTPTIKTDILDYKVTVTKPDSSEYEIPFKMAVGDENNLVDDSSGGGNGGGLLIFPPLKTG